MIQFIFTILPPILGEQGYSLVTTWIPFTQGCLVPSFLKWNHILFLDQQRSKNTLTPFQKFKLSGSEEEVKIVKSLQQQWITDKSGSENLTWSFDSDELMNRIIVKSISYAFDHRVTWADMQYDMDFSMLHSPCTGYMIIDTFSHFLFNNPLLVIKIDTIWQCLFCTLHVYTVNTC